ncbi:c-type cytochrome [Microvirga roseola]|uniref:c-type cytochrome n=1 Tax=Microvirga roseola TaxID=2883126 RepID=UPI001E3FA82D|nr:c-type cytochrome [Microvirga roseola]
MSSLPRVLAAALLLGAPLPAVAGDAARGERVFQYCYSCHSVQPGETNLQGPNLAGILGRPIAAQEGFDYSPAMQAFAAREEVWSQELLDRFIAAPEEVVPRTSMDWRGLDDASERADLIAYLRAASP